MFRSGARCGPHSGLSLLRRLGPGCTVVNPVQTSSLVNSTNYDAQANANLGCVVENPDPSSYGADFASAGGGVFVTEFAKTDIS